VQGGEGGDGATEGVASEHDCLAPDLIQ